MHPTFRIKFNATKTMSVRQQERDLVVFYFIAKIEFFYAMRINKMEKCEQIWSMKWIGMNAS